MSKRSPAAEAWAEAARDNLHAAKELRRSGRVRSCLNRSYYSAYALITGSLVGRGVDVSSSGRPNPGHHQLQGLAGRLGRSARSDRVATELKTLWRLRVTADYEPQSALTESDAVMALKSVSRLHKKLGGAA